MCQEELEEGEWIVAGEKPKYVPRGVRRKRGQERESRR